MSLASRALVAVALASLLGAVARAQEGEGMMDLEGDVGTGATSQAMGGPTRSPRMQVDSAPVRADGVAADVVTATVRSLYRQRTRLTRCFAEYLERTPDARGDLEVTVVIEPDATRSSGRISGGSLRATGVGACAERVVAQLVTAPADARAELTLRVRFEPPDLAQLEVTVVGPRAVRGPGRLDRRALAPILGLLRARAQRCLSLHGPREARRVAIRVSVAADGAVTTDLDASEAETAEACIAAAVREQPLPVTRGAASFALSFDARVARPPRARTSRGLGLQAVTER